MSVIVSMELSNRVMAAFFFCLFILLVFSSEEPVPYTKSHDVWRGVVTTVTAKGVMLSTESGNYWVSDKSLSVLALKGDSALVIGYRSGMFISPFSIRLKKSTSFFASMRRLYRERLISTIPDPVARGLTGGLLMGLRGLIPARTAQAFKESGTSHMLALSGLHTGMIAVGLLWFFRLLLGKGISSGWVTVCGIVLFVVLSGGRVSTVRAGVMASFAVLWKNYHGGKLHLLSVWWLALMLSLIFLPETLKDKGAQMSYGAVLSLIVLGKRSQGRFSTAKSALLAGLVVTISLAPLMMSTYGGLFWLGPIATVISVPLMSFVMSLGFLTSLGFHYASILLNLTSWIWVGILQFLGHTPIVIEKSVLYPLWIFLVLLLRIFSRWNGFNRRFR